jgi:hypothetical protein
MMNKGNEMDILTHALASRSRLYPLAPQGKGTPLIESLSSYINRLAWIYGVNPRILVTQEIFPNLCRSHHTRTSPGRLGNFCQEDVKTINGIGEAAADWSQTLERLTMRSDLQSLTLNEWASGFSPFGLLNPSPRWCPICYYEWREKGLPIYQPLQWSLRDITICLLHKRQLVQLCPHCKKKQSTIAATSRLGFCTRCNCWLGVSAVGTEVNEIDDDQLRWQYWIVNVIEELRRTVISQGSLPWSGLTTGLSTCIEIFGSARSLARRVGISYVVFQRWKKCISKPSFRSMLVFCRALNITPLRLLIDEFVSIEESVIGEGSTHESLTKPKLYERVDRKRAFELIQAVLVGREDFLSVRGIGRRLEYNPVSIVYHFPQECARVTAQYRAYCTQRSDKRIKEMCEEVRQVTLALHREGVIPSLRKVSVRLSHPSMLRTKEAKATWHDTRREIGLE